ncbi:MAG: Gfo/Idh/MocA family oxidoreductase [Opitutaceae bacterium]|nr:Gfo/Idh/MocA family oxidoreductase [Opitutaceae bacterium]
MTPLRGAVVGCGMIAEFHLRGWMRIPGVRIVALVDPNRAAAENYRDRFVPAARLYADIDALLASEPIDFVDIVTPPSRHQEHCLRAKAAHLHVICQKPLCPELAMAQELVRAFAGSEKLFCVHENHIYRPWFQQVRTLHRLGTLGSLRRVSLEQHDPQGPPQVFSRESRRGVLLEYGVHLVDMIRTLLGVPTRVSARLGHIHPAVRGESLAEVTFDYPETTATIDIAWRNDGLARGRALFLGDRGQALYEGTMIRGGASRFRVRTGQPPDVDETRETVADYVESFHLFQFDFANAIRNGTPGPQPAAENLQTLAMVFAAYAAAERQEAVDFSTFGGGPT